jgi:predicted  nucleic acid-binding Zn-ribbon protein
MKRQSVQSAVQQVRCLDCGTVYDQPPQQEESAPCPACGYVGWIAVWNDASEKNT